MAALVAPRAGAWIETWAEACQQYCQASRPARARGLKLAKRLNLNKEMIVAPHAGAWIET